ncbi:GNAT family N-acetyltransferase [Sandaracinus amylolyticus]|uniref:Ribosomal-protein-S5p-alanine acetyltransferase n=1 Tax=Sandaracinus amylolyticus TaxID=927083 RepID=A0A0F6YHP4_9BACT|nr:GNAT family N-acetyltransferase [Sandaracinus amylolyticus]AKF05295.1 Ribosomal-protein-S5p-alanine acetyltransferase [Sandaracinus amylolyticus]
MRPRLETKRLVLRLAEPLEAHLVVDYLDRNRAHLARWEPDPPPGFYTEAYWRERIHQLRREEDEGRLVRVHMFERGARDARVVGTIGLSNIVRGAFHNAHLGFGLDGALEGHGYMREALEAMIEYAFGPLELHRLEANHQPHNLRSAGLLRRLGFVPTGYARDYLHIDGTWRDHVQTALINDRWRKSSRSS